MTDAIAGHRGTLVRWGAIAFAVAGLARLTAMATNYAGQYTGIPVPELAGPVSIVTAYGVAMLGLGGLYSLVVDRSPRLARVGAIAAGIVVVSLVGAAIGRYLIGGDGSSVFGLFVSLSFYVFTTLAFLLFGLASRRTPALSRSVGALLLLAAVSRLVTIVGGVLGLLWVAEIGTLLYALPLLVLGYHLRTEFRSTDRNDVQASVLTK